MRGAPVAVGLIGLFLLSGCWNFAEDLQSCQRLGRCGAELVDAGSSGPRVFEEQHRETQVDLNTIWGPSEEEVYVVGGKARFLRRGSGGGFSSVVPFPSSEHLYGLFGRANGELYVSGTQGFLARFDGTGWVSEGPSGNELYAVTGAPQPGGELYAVGERSAALGTGVIFRRAGGGWVEDHTTTAGKLLGVWHDGNQAWAVGENGIILRRSAGVWAPVPGAGSTVLIDVWGAAADDVWAVGMDGKVLHWNGTQWSLSNTGTAAHLRGVSGSGPSDVWVVGDAGLVMQWDGQQWRVHPTQISETLYGVWVSPAGAVWAVGSAGGIYRALAP